MSADNIPKVIHYCWFGKNKLPKSALLCINSWKKYLPDYEVKEWNESNFDVNIIQYTKDAYNARKYAYVSDFARFWILYNYGGLYFDTDVELINPIYDIIENGAFMGFENEFKPNLKKEELYVAPGLGLGVSSHHPLYREIVELYKNIQFVNPRNEKKPVTIVDIVSDLLLSKGLKSVPGIQNIEHISIYPSDYFCPISTEDGKLRITSNTRSIHWYDQSWQSPIRKYIRKLILNTGGTRLKRIIKNIVFK